MGSISGAIRAWKYGGIKEVGAKFADGLRAAGPLPLVELFQDHRAVTNSPREAIYWLASEEGRMAPSDADLDKWDAEWQSTLDHAPVRVVAVSPAEWDIDEKTSQILYFLIRWRKPAVALETGVARGASSLVILAAMEANTIGDLFSFDVSSDVGELVPDHLRSRWHLVELGTNRVRNVFITALAGIGGIDFFFHDSDHTDRWIDFELRTVIPQLHPNALFAADDVHNSKSFLRRSESSAWSSAILLDQRKASGFAIR